MRLVLPQDASATKAFFHPFLSKNTRKKKMRCVKTKNFLPVLSLLNINTNTNKNPAMDEAADDFLHEIAVDTKLLFQ